MSLERIVAVISAIITIVISIFSAYYFLDKEHKGYTDTARSEIEQEKEIAALETERKLVEIDKDRNEKIRAFYESKEDTEGKLKTYDQRRYEQILREIDRQEQKLDILDGTIRKWDK